MTELSEYDKGIIDNVAEHGWFATGVFDPDGKNPNFTYSTGFPKTLNAPEFIVFGLDNSLMHKMLWEVFRQLKAGAVPKDGMRWHNVLDGFDCISKKATDLNLYEEYMRSADWFWRHEGNSGHPEVYQLVWPGAQQGLFPWENDCDSYVISQQPQLWATIN